MTRAEDPAQPERGGLRAEDPVDRLVGIGAKTAARLAEAGILSVLDLLLHIPARYEDRGSVIALAEALGAVGPRLLYGRLTVRSARHVRRRLHITDGLFTDASGSVRVRWFNQPWMADRIGDGADAYVFGSIGSGKTGERQLVNPEIEKATSCGNPERIVPVYPKLGPLGGKRLAVLIRQALEALPTVVEPLTKTLVAGLELPDLADALEALHLPPVPEVRAQREAAVEALNRRSTTAHRRLAFDELLAVAAVAAGYRARRLEQTAEPVRVRASFTDDIRSFFAFEFTGAQQRAVAEILADMARPSPMARLLQGDVGSGKTAVATTAVLAALAAGRQAAIMAPTEILAEQLHRSLGAALHPTGVPVRLLTGALPAAGAREIRDGLRTGEVKIVVGTHALFQEKVGYADLGLVVIDEQHRFGVAQRQRLLDKGASPHLLVMTATPIPRSLALTLYGDLDLSVIDELPPGRRPVRTEVRDRDARERIYAFLRSEIEAGGQGFVVCPVIDPTSKIEAASLADHESWVRSVLGDIEVGVLHGRLDREEREAVAGRFRDGDLKVILATTVIEVGVDVPGASVMIVESADRFGLSQLHQLRGRVGRGQRRSWCVLVTGDEPSAAAVARLGVLAETTDGFEIAEADLRHRGPGELTGVRQWGADGFRFADLVRDHDLVGATRAVARRLAEEGSLDEIRDRLLRIHPVGRSFAVG